MALSPISGSIGGLVSPLRTTDTKPTEPVTTDNSSQVTGSNTTQGTTETKLTDAISAPEAADKSDPAGESRGNTQTLTEPSRADARSVVQAIAVDAEVRDGQAELDEARASAEANRAEARDQGILDRLAAPVEVATLDPVTPDADDQDLDPYAVSEPPAKPDAA